MTPPSAPTSPAVPTAIAEFPARYARTARFSLGTPRNLTVIAGGSQVLFCRSGDAESSVLGLWSLDVEAGDERLIVDPSLLGGADDDLPPAERARRERARESASGIVAYSVDDAGSTVCFSLAGSLFVVDTASGEVSSPTVAGTVFDPRLNAQGSAVAYVDGQDLCVVRLGTGEGIGGPVLSDPDPMVSCGRADFIAAEEMQRSRGYWWSPDGESLLATVVDENPVTEWWIAEPAHPDRPPRSVRYPAAGSANAAVDLRWVSLDGRTTSVGWSDGGRFEYLADVVWSKGRPPLVVRQTRDQRTVSIAEVDLEGGHVTERRAITDPVWVELIAGSPRWCSSGLLTVEDFTADGAVDTRRLVLDGSPITEPGLQVKSIVGTVRGEDDGTDASVVVSAWTEPTEIHLLEVPLPRTGAPGGATASESRTPRILTGAGGGVNAGVLAHNTLVVVASGPEQAGSETTVHRFDHSGTLSAAVARIPDLSADPGFRSEPLFVSLGPDQLPSAVFLPSNHDGADPLPVLLDPYGGPHAQRVLRTHNAHLVSRWFAEHGYAVVVTDGRGTPGRGPSWEREVWGNLAEPVLTDQIAALDAALDRHPFLDADRVGIRGWSFGGFLAALALLERPDRFHAAVAGAPVTSWHLYDTHYTERYLGHPSEHPEHYRRSGLWADGEHGPEVAPLTRPMLLIHGLADDNVVAANTLRFSTALLATGSPHRVLPLSGVTHMTPQVAVAENLLRLQLDFLDETIGGRR